MPYDFTKPGIRSFEWWAGVLEALSPTQYPALARTLLFQGEVPVMGETVNWDLLGQFAAAGAEPNDPNASPLPVRPVVNQARQVALTYFSEEYPIPSAVLAERPPGVPPSGVDEALVRNNVDQVLVRYVRDLRDRVVTRLQAIAWGLMVDGEYEYQGRGYGISLHSGRNENLAINAGVTWSSTGDGNPYQDLQVLLNAVARYGGIRPDTIIFGGTAWTYAIANETFRQALTPSQSGPSILYTAQAGGQVTPTTAEAAYTPTLLGQFQGVSCYLCNELAADGTTPYLPETSVIALNRVAYGGPVYYGTIQNFRAYTGGSVLVPWFPYDVEDSYGKNRNLVLETRRLWLPPNVNACGVLDTKAV